MLAGLIAICLIVAVVTYIFPHLEYTLMGVKWVPSKKDLEEERIIRANKGKNDMLSALAD